MPRPEGTADLPQDEGGASTAVVGGRPRCPWADADPLLAAYHDEERGRFPASEAGLFEALSLDVLKGTWPWREILAARGPIRGAFLGFDPDRVASIDEGGVGRICRALGMERRRGRVRAITQNARRLVAARSDWGSGPDDRDAFGRWLRSTDPGLIVAELRTRFRHVGAGAARGFVEAVGLVPLGHAPDCWRARAVIFDLDGVVVDSELLWDGVRREMAAEAGTEWTDEDRASLMGGNTREWSERMVERRFAGRDPAEIAAETVRRVVARYAAGHPPVIAGAAGAIRAIAARHPVALASSAHPDVIDAALRAVGLDGVFEVIVSSDEVRAGKPEPDVYEEAARRLALAPSSCLAVEDSLAGVRAAQAAGIAVARVPNPSVPPPPEAAAAATVVVDRLADLDPDTVLDEARARAGRSGPAPVR